MGMSALGVLFGIIYQLFGPAMAGVLPLATQRIKLAWSWWLASVFGGVIASFVEFRMLQIQDQLLKSALAENLPAMPKSLDSVVPLIVLSWVPAVIALIIWFGLRPDRTDPPSKRYKITVIVGIYILTYLIRFLYFSFTLKSA